MLCPSDWQSFQLVQPEPASLRPRLLNYRQEVVRERLCTQLIQHEAYALEDLAMHALEREAEMIEREQTVQSLASQAGD